MRLSTGVARRGGMKSLGARTLLVAAVLLGLGGSIGAAPAAAVVAAPLKVVIVVGPTGSGTAHYKSSAQALAAKARGYGATVVEVYSPNATWGKVKSAAQGANVLIYLGHGSGWPSPYAPFTSKKKDGMGLNASAAHGNNNVKYYGEWYLAHYIHLAPNAVVLLQGLCYSAGNSEPGKAAPRVSTGMKRIDNYGAGFLRTGARAVFAEPYGSVGYVLDAIFTADTNVGDLFHTGGSHWGSSGVGYYTTFASTRTSWATAISWRDSSKKFRRSVVGDLTLTMASVRGS